MTPDKFLTPARAKALLATTAGRRREAMQQQDRAGVRNAVIVDALLGSGMRVSEACGLSVGDAFLDKGAEFLLVRRGKGGKSRMIAIGEVLASTLRDFITWKGRVGESTAPERALFRSRRGGHLSRSAVHRLWKAALAQAGLPTRWGVHATRHSYAVEVYRQTRDLRLTQRLLGHASVSTTTVYANLLDEDVRAGVERVWS